MRNAIKLLAFILLSAVFISSAVSCRYDPPDGYTEEHHTYEEVLAYAKEIDRDAIVYEEYTDGMIDSWDRALREWDAVIHGTPCHVASVAHPIWNSGFLGGEFNKHFYRIETDYDHTALLKILSDRAPEWILPVTADERYQLNGSLHVEAHASEEVKLSDDELRAFIETASEIDSIYESTVPFGKDVSYGIPTPTKIINGSTGEVMGTSVSMRYISSFTDGDIEKFISDYTKAWELVQ